MSFLDKLKAFMKKYKSLIALSFCFIFAISASLLLPINKAEAPPVPDDTKISEAKAFITKGQDESVDKQYKKGNTEIMPEERHKKETVLPEAFPESAYEKEPLVTKEDMEDKKAVTASATSPFSPDMPIKGEKLTPYSVSPIYSHTMEDWRSHEAIDIAAELGSDVAASEKGRITFVGKDPLLGICIRISHGENFETLYANLHTETRVYEGQEISKGQIIGHVGESSVIESGTEPHLHFELFKNGKRVNPEEYIR